jgi:microcystin degradation protein MlrC
MRLFAATIATESNTFSPMPTSLAAYKECVFLRPGEHPEQAPLMCTAPLWVARRRAAADARREFHLVELRTQASDHPVLLAAKETQYLKCAILQALN